MGRDANLPEVKIWFEDSANLDRAEYDPTLQILSLWFRGCKTQYQYLGVPDDVILKLAQAASPGATFRALVKGRYECMKIG